jgi:enterochelin esterase-like enzyme
MVARPTSEKWILLCCSLQTPLAAIHGSDAGAITVRVPRLREAVLMLSTFPAGKQVMDTYRGPDAEPVPSRLEVAPETITTIDLPSKNLGRSRRVTVYVPAGTPIGSRLPVLYLGDGSTRAFAPIAAAAVRDGRAKPAVLVGIDAASSKDCGDCDARGEEYVPEFGANDPQGRYQRHQRFVIEELIPYIEANYPVSTARKERAIGGYSNGAVWALTTAARHPELFGGALVMSAGAKSAVDGAARLKTVRVFAGAGVFEPNFHDRTSRAVAVAQVAGGEARFREVVGGHAQSTWDLIFGDGYRWLFPAT